MNKWYKFLAEASREFFDKNVEIIHNIPLDKKNMTLMVINEMESDEFSKLLKDSGVSKIINEYQIDKLLGMGAKGLVFSLKYPHENYILKFQIDGEEEFREAGEVGTEYPFHLYKKQEQDIYDPKEMRVLDSVKNFARGGQDEEFFVSAIIMSKLSMTSESGITTDEIMEDVRKTQIKFHIIRMVDYKYNKDKAKNLFIKVLERDGYHPDDVQKFLNLIDAGKYEELFKIFYDLNKKHGNIKYMNENQFVSFCLQLFKVYDEGFQKKGSHVVVDLHSGNFGFRPNSDNVMFFDI